MEEPQHLVKKNITLTVQKMYREKARCTRMLQAILNKSWKQEFKKQQMYSHLLPISKTIQIRQIQHISTGEAKTNLEMRFY